MPSRRTPPRLLTIAGSDSGGGAGIQADLKTFAAHGAYGMSVITALTAQNTRGVRAVQEASADFVAAQIDSVFEDIGADAVKIGMLASAPIVRIVADRLRWWLERTPVPVVLDPVMIAKSGHPLLRDDAVEAVIEDLVPLSTLVTPNVPELERMTGIHGQSEDDRLRAAAELAARGPGVLAKGGHAQGEEVVDLLVEPEGNVHRFRHPRLETSSTHGTGCTLSSAIAARLARGEELATAVGGAVTWLHAAMEAAYPLGSGHGPVNHLHELFKEEEEA
ncbi:MAG TPA: bifunctional hydroxymethylpyrimidine kinase/phosphomethylpyrimidine kinase [Thermoanaerobaculia bacterium]|jgi:hydroxymethylpyrimidine/phosphomethylpyrimidine kinase|nr:bifunctional hydroxymethylpyrimidine kinase/phosphomethylpyrimidine kinase [Thermoanaerobaculia bacterium]